MDEILVTRRLPSATLDTLRTVGIVDLAQAPGGLSSDEIRTRVVGKSGLVCMVTDVIDRQVVDAGSRLKVIANVAVGFNNIDVAYARARGIVVTNTPDVLTQSVADFTWALILAITRRVAEGDRLVRRGGWKGWGFDFMLGTELGGRQLGLVGLGRIGRAVAERAAPFGLRVAYVTRRETEIARAVRLSLDELLVTSDIVSLHVPLNDATRHLIDRRALARMKRSAYLVNTARGPVVDEAALVWALQEGLIAGAALDVYEDEPRVHEGLLRLENVLLVPHLGSATTETRTAMADLAARNVVAVLQGRPALTPIA
jgi:glyoxylate reductase